MDREKVIECLQKAKMVIETWIPLFEQYNTPAGIDDAIALLKEQEKEIKALRLLVAWATDYDFGFEQFRQDAERYREAYGNGYDTGYQKRDEEIIRCKDCKHYDPDGIYTECYRHNGLSQAPDWFCADGERRSDP